MVSKEEIKHAAFALFAEKGYEATSTQDIAAAVGLKKQSLYSHFKSKNEIFLEVLSDESEIILAELEQTFEINKNNSVEVFLQKTFEKLIQIFSLRYRLLLFKRTILLYATRHTYTFIEEFFDNLNNTLKKNMREIMVDHYCLFDGQEEYLLFYSYFMLNIYGFMEIMLLTSKTDESFEQVVWEKLWKGVLSYFK